ncbi:SGNH/GDSL hydrolase family protein [Streptomyces sp. NPDC060194]|uniref:SGNH/GDSL hydrolase family protein n=1 Tax=Streptomyces sp. NPDC060194 TaxID=3347069 RepID=UPI00365D2DDD
MRAPRFAALGDSLTAGVGDPVSGGRPRGWAALLAGGLAAGPEPAEFLNLAVSGAVSADVVRGQLAAALAFDPDLASVVVGVNDTLRCSFDIHAYARRLDTVLAELTGRGTVVLTACLPDPGALIGLPAPLARPLARRQRAVNAVVHELSRRYDAVHLHAASPPPGPEFRSGDRLHPSERGHRRLAAGFHVLLSARGLAPGPRPRLEPDRPAPARAASLWLLATTGTGWVLRRCGDLLPQLLLLAAAEIRHERRGGGTALELSAARAVVAALGQLPLRGTNRSGVPEAA